MSKGPSRTDLQGQLSREIVEFQNATDAVDEAASEILGLNRTDMRALGLLQFRGPMTAGQLAEAMSLSPGAMTTALDRLESRGFVRRRIDAEDRRRVLIEVTNEALAISNDLYGPLARAGSERMRHLSEEELRVILDFVRYGRELQEQHASSLRERAAVMADPSGDVKTIARRYKTTAKQATREFTAAMKGLKADLKADVKAAARGRRGS
jgi:DNA-binding MarR family transcriptional regulator